MDFELRSDLPFIGLTLVYRATQFEVNDVLIDTGSATTLFASDCLSRFEIVPQSGDKIRKITGVGGSEYVIEKRIDAIIVGDTVIKDVCIEIGEMDYGFTINGILGSALLAKARATINYKNNTITF